MEKTYRFKYGSSKKSGEAINRFNYHIHNTVPILFGTEGKSLENGSGTLKSSKGQNNLVYFWSKQYQEAEILVDEQSILHSIKATHLSCATSQEEIFKLNEKCYQK